MSVDNPKDLEAHFEFGGNWLDYLHKVDQAAILHAERGLAKLVPLERIRGSRFLDLGCGSGLHSLAALRLGATELVSIDIDPNSVAATRALLAQWAPETQPDLRVLSIFDAEPETLGTFDIVYSWGVLHHTGAMWEAIERATRLVKPGGIFALAIYEKRPSCAFWHREKKLYARAPEPLRRTIRGLYKGLFFTGLLATGRNPARYVRTYKSSRGMSFHHDVHDWLGGYPYESASVDEMRTRMDAMGFETVTVKTIRKGLRLLGTGCAEYRLIHRQPDAVR